MPDGWIRLTIADPPLVMEFPPDWHAQSLGDAALQIQSLLAGQTGDAAKQLQSALEDITSGHVRFIAQGPASVAGVTIGIAIYVDSGDASLDAAVGRSLDVIRASNHAVTLTGQVDRRLPLGLAVRLHWAIPALGTGSVASQSYEYVLRLADGRTVTMSMTSVASDSGFESLADSIVSSMSLAP